MTTFSILNGTWGVLSGRLVDDKTGNPIADTRFRLVSQKLPLSAQAVRFFAVFGDGPEGLRPNAINLMFVGVRD